MLGELIYDPLFSAHCSSNVDLTNLTKKKRERKTKIYE